MSGVAYQCVKLALSKWHGLQQAHENVDALLAAASMSSEMVEDVDPPAGEAAREESNELGVVSGPAEPGAEGAPAPSTQAESLEVNDAGAFRGGSGDGRSDSVSRRGEELGAAEDAGAGQQKSGSAGEDGSATKEAAIKQEQAPTEGGAVKGLPPCTCRMHA